ncbi:hypothetical protein Lal_00042196 [Lupinus albus]|nr:hypothetical protein Lal_00042196 [Lupinus albus]
MKLGCLTLHEESNKKKKGISLIATTSNTKVHEEKSNEEESDSYDIDDETMTVLVNIYNKFLKKKGELRKFQRRDTKDSTERSKYSNDKITFHECRKDAREIKAKKAYIVCDVPEKEATSSTLDDEKSTKLCLVVQNHNSCDKNEQNDLGDSSEVSNSDSDNSPTYDIVYNA